MRQQPVFKFGVFLGLLLVSACRQGVPQTSEVPVVRIMTVLGRVTKPLADALTKVLPERFPAQIQVIRTPAGANPARLIEEGQAELSMVPADVAFMAYTKGTPDLPRPYRKLRGVALLYPTVLH